MLLVLWGYVLLRRALERPSIGRSPARGVIAALLLYTVVLVIYLLAVVGDRHLVVRGPWAGARAGRPAGGPGS